MTLKPIYGSNTTDNEGKICQQTLCTDNGSCLPFDDLDACYSEILRRVFFTGLPVGAQF